MDTASLGKQTSENVLQPALTAKGAEEQSGHGSTLRSGGILPSLFLLSVVTYLDRVIISIVSPAIRGEFGIDPLHIGVIFSAFVVGYMLFQIPGGWVGDRFGHKKTLITCLILWSIFTGMTPLVGHASVTAVVGLLPGLWILRFLVGVFEAAAYPCANGIIGGCFAPSRRAFAAGVMFAGIGVGSALTPPFVAWCMVHFGWRSAFYISAVFGMVLAIALQWGVPTERSRRRVDWQRPRTPWREILTSSQIWLLTTSIFFFGYVTYVYFFWFYPYLVDIRGFSLLRGSLFTALPFVMMAIGAPLGGAVSDRLVSRIGKARARRRVAMTGLISAAVLIPCGATIANPYGAIVCLSLGAGSVYLAISGYFAAALDVFPEHGATTSGTMNTGAGLGGIVAPIITPYVAGTLGWVAALSVAGVCAFIAAILWRFIGSTGAGSSGQPEAGAE